MCKRSQTIIIFKNKGAIGVSDFVFNFSLRLQIWKSVIFSSRFPKLMTLSLFYQKTTGNKCKLVKKKFK